MSFAKALCIRNESLKFRGFPCRQKKHGKFSKSCASRGGGDNSVYVHLKEKEFKWKRNFEKKSSVWRIFRILRSFLYKCVILTKLLFDSAKNEKKKLFPVFTTID